MKELEIAKCKPSSPHLLAIRNRYKDLFENRYIGRTLQEFEDCIVLVKGGLIIHNDEHSNIIAGYESKLESYLEKVNNYYLNL